jgi:hypothetical protein
VDTTDNAGNILAATEKSQAGMIPWDLRLDLFKSSAENGRGILPKRCIYYQDDQEMCHYLPRQGVPFLMSRCGGRSSAAPLLLWEFALAAFTSFTKSCFIYEHICTIRNTKMVKPT